MDELTYIEVLGRHGEVVARHAAPRLPVKIGRAYDNDLILDDPYVAPHHVVVERSPTGDLELVDAGSRNGLFRVGAAQRLGRERIDPHARYRAGRTELRIRASTHTVPAELPDRGSGSWRQAAVAATSVLASAAMLFVFCWSTTFERTDPAKLVLPPATLVLALFLWSGAWSLAGRLLLGESRFAAHLTAAALAVAAFFIAGNWDYLAFALSWSWLLYPALSVMGAVLAWGLWRHLSLVTRNPGRGVALAAATVAAVTVGSYALYVHVDRADDATRMGYLKTVKSPAVRLATGREAGAFFGEAEKLKSELEPLKTK